MTPELRAWQGHLTGLWKYDFGDVDFRRLVQDIMRQVPHEKREYLPGLYEFHIVLCGGATYLAKGTFVTDHFVWSDLTPHMH